MNKIMNYEPVVLTHSGQYVNIKDPDPQTINFADIAHGLSHICRYTGQTSVFYSVAEHSVHCARHLRTLGYSPMAQLAALLHDATEAYIQDISTPLKKLLPEYKGLEANFEAVIEEKFGIAIAGRPEVRMADMQLLATERAILFAEQTPWEATDGINPDGYLPKGGLGWSSEKAHKTFGSAYICLRGEIDQLNGV